MLWNFSYTNKVHKIQNICIQEKNKQQQHSIHCDLCDEYCACTFIYHKNIQWLIWCVCVSVSLCVCVFKSEVICTWYVKLLTIRKIVHFNWNFWLQSIHIFRFFVCVLVYRLVFRLEIFLVTIPFGQRAFGSNQR